jgi:hypothetical protein
MEMAIAMPRAGIAFAISETTIAILGVAEMAFETAIAILAIA